MLKTLISGYAPPGNYIWDPLPMGSYDDSFEYFGYCNTSNYTNTFNGRPTRDVFHTFTLTKRMQVLMTHCGSTLADTYIHLLDAQGTEINFNDDYEGDAACSSYKHAVMCVMLDPGTYYIVSEGWDKDGEIVINIKALVDQIGYTHTPNQFSSEPESVEVSDVDFKVSPTGGTTFEIPIECLPWREGLTPKIAIRYDSQAGNGVAGLGTTISGLSSIKRAACDIAHDGAAKPIQNTFADAMYLDGVRLMNLYGIPGQTDCVHVLENNPKIKVREYNGYYGTICNSWFNLYHPDGLESTYGSMGEARVISDDHKVSSFLIDGTMDGDGKRMNYWYKTQDYYPYLSSITYGDIDGVGDTIYFRYENRPDPISYIENGLNVKITQRLAQIDCVSRGNLYRHYQLIYKEDHNTSLLGAVEKQNGAGDLAKQTVIKWNLFPDFSQNISKTPNIQAAQVNPAVGFDAQNIQSADLNGDGISDLFSFFPINAVVGNQTYSTNYMYVYWGSMDASGNPQFLQDTIYDLGPTVNSGSNKNIFGSCVSSDMDGDGIPEVIVPTLFTSSTEKSVKFQRMNKKSRSTITCSLLLANEMPLYAFGDLNNDGKEDLVMLPRESYGGSYRAELVGFNADGSVLERAQINLSFQQKPMRLFVCDCNGDGLKDILVFYSTGYTIYWNQGGRSIGAQTILATKYTTGTNVAYCYKMEPGDFNGDGAIDFLLGTTQSNQWYFAFNNGNGTFNKQLACTLDIFDQDYTEKDNDKFSCKVLDFTGDGKSDVVITKAMYVRKSDLFSTWGEFRLTYTYWMRSSCNVLAPDKVVTSTKESDALSCCILTGDFDRDGRTELMNYGYDFLSGVSGTPSWHWYKNPGLNPSTGLVSQVTPGLGEKYTITYDYLGRPGIYTRGTNAKYPIMDIYPKLNAVKLINKDMGAPGLTNVCYSYQGAKQHMQGRGLLGFMQTKVLDGPHIYENTITSFDSTFYFPTETRYKHTMSGKSEEVNTYNQKIKFGDLAYFAYPATKIEKDLDGNISTTYTQYGTNYNLAEVRTEYGGSNMYKSTKYDDYLSMGFCSKPQTITKVYKHADDAQETPVVQKLLYDTSNKRPYSVIYNDNTLAKVEYRCDFEYSGACVHYEIYGVELLEDRYFEYDDSRRHLVRSYTYPASVEMAYTYDELGNMLTKSDVTDPENPITTSYTYDKWGKITSMTDPAGNKTLYSNGWNLNSGERRYFTLKQGKGQPWEKLWFDANRRQTDIDKVEKQDGIFHLERDFDSNGNLFHTHVDYCWYDMNEFFDYDYRGRVINATTDGGNEILTTYGNRSCSIMDNGREYTKTFDAWGNTKSISDPVGSVNFTFASIGKPAQITANGSSYGMEFDVLGRQVALTDPNSGRSSWLYDVYGTLAESRNPLGNGYYRQFGYDGKIHTTYAGDFKNSYTYGTSGSELQRLVRIDRGDDAISYEHDPLGRLTSETFTLAGGGEMKYNYTYHEDGKIASTIYPGGLEVRNEYDVYGNKVKIVASGMPMWQYVSRNEYCNTSIIGGVFTNAISLDYMRRITNIRTTKNATVYHDISFNFDLRNNMVYRKGMLPQQETFYYDDADRLLQVKQGSTEVLNMEMTYAVNGNINSKTGLGNYVYASGKPHAVETVANTDTLISNKDQTITYNSVNNVSQITEVIGSDLYKLNFLYSPKDELWKSELSKNGTIVRTTLYGPEYEKVTENGVTRNVYYIYSMDGLAAVYVKQDGQADAVYYANLDHQGSVVSLMDASGNIVFKASYDAWGKQKIELNNCNFYHGYAAYEHIPEFGLVNMGGRLYDPALGRYLSPAKSFPTEATSQAYNSYSMNQNNPLNYKRPSVLRYFPPFAYRNPRDGFFK